MVRRFRAQLLTLRQFDLWDWIEAHSAWAVAAALAVVVITTVAMGLADG